MNKFWNEHEQEIIKICNKFVKQYRIYTKQELLQQAALIVFENKSITMNRLNYELDYYCKKERTYIQRYNNCDINTLDNF